MTASLTDHAVAALVAAIFDGESPAVVEAYSAFGEGLRWFQSAEELSGYLREQRESAAQSAHFAICYPDMGGAVQCSRLQLDPETCQGHSFRYGASGWGLIWVYLTWRPNPVGSFVSANSEKRALAWAVSHPELGDPAHWNWPVVNRHLRRLKRVFKLAAV